MKRILLIFALCLMNVSASAFEWPDPSNDTAYSGTQAVASTYNRP